MLKKTLFLLAAAALLLSLVGCGVVTGLLFQNSTESGGGKPTEFQPEDTGSASQPEGTEPETEAVPDYDAQLALIANACDTWVKSDSFDRYSYSVTDLDQNGRLEVIATVCAGSGMFSYTDIWEVNEGGDGLSLCDGSAFGDNSQPDLVSTQETTAYYVPHDGADYGTYHYVFTDYIRNGAAESMQILQTLSLSQHTIALRQLAVRHQTYDPETEQETVTYSADSGEEISEEAYLAAADDFFEGMEKYKARFAWFSPAQEELQGMNAEQWLSELRTLWQGFALEKQ